jgi:hypothetical protein
MLSEMYKYMEVVIIIPCEHQHLPHTNMAYKSLVFPVSYHEPYREHVKIFKPWLLKLSRNGYRILVGKPEGKSPLRRPRCRWVDNIKMDLKIDRMD